MLIYRFKIINDEHDNFYREIEIKPGNTFIDFHNILLQCINFTPGEMASFYICDYKWNKLQEISLCDMTEPVDNKEEDEKETAPVKMMTDVKLKECINDPHQRLIYVYDFLKLFTFYIELSKITEGEEGKYPRCIKSTGDIQKPKKMPHKKEGLPEAYEEEEIAEEDDDIFSEDNTSFNEDDLNLGDGFEDTKFM